MFAHDPARRGLRPPPLGLGPPSVEGPGPACYESPERSASASQALAPQEVRHGEDDRPLGAFAALSIEEFRAQMEGKTWLDRDAEALLDEAPGAYKPIETVIADSADLIEPVTVLSQFINYKGL